MAGLAKPPTTMYNKNSQSSTQKQHNSTVLEPRETEKALEIKSFSRWAALNTPTALGQSMAFKRSAVRSRLSPPENTDSTLNRCFFLTFFVFLFCWVNEKVNRISRFCPLSRRKDGQDGLHPKFSKNYPTLLEKFKNQADFAQIGKKLLDFLLRAWYN